MDVVSFLLCKYLGMAWSYGEYIFKYVRNYQTVFPKWCALLHSHQQYVCVHSLHFFALVILAISVRVKWYPTVVSIHTFLRTNAVEYLVLICHLYIILIDVSFKIFCLFLNWAVCLICVPGSRSPRLTLNGKVWLAPPHFRMIFDGPETPGIFFISRKIKCFISSVLRHSLSRLHKEQGS